MEWEMLLMEHNIPGNMNFVGEKIEDFVGLLMWWITKESTWFGPCIKLGSVIG